MRQGKRASALLGAAALVATSSCGVYGGDDEGGGDETRLVELMNETYGLEADLSEAEYRIIQNCLEEQGHTVHDQWEMQTWEAFELESLTDYYPYESFLPEADSAAKWGFGQWSNAEEAWESGEADEYQDERSGEDEEGFDDVDNSEFESLSPQEQFDWYSAYYGDEYAHEYYSWTLDPEDGLEDGEPYEEELLEEESDGELEVEGESYDEPKPGGCKLEMIEALYGEPRQVTNDEGGEGTHTYWEWRPSGPEEEADWEELSLTYRAAVQDEEYAFLDCIAEAGYGDWEFSEWGELLIWRYFEPVYFEDEEASMVYADGYAPETPEPPADVPSDYEGKKAWEIDMAVGFVECGESTGYRDAAERAWDETQLDHYLAMEEDMFAHQEQMREAIAKAQDLIDS
ncbi:hypothetical protein L0U85_15325 [Glycomyces sp. L485]|uniref:hypothetical protein n=1 Tax=Glycomyces sp. L485 TaxID=2909235 RepID=UPI001F4A530E|nr:hypothetical protein [Glycomyces sp. L485]MCH7232216.1 hypothetical protein [Glycomyces sp. L485]